MVNHLSKSIVRFFLKKNIIPKEEIDSYIYGFQIILISSINWGAILLIMLMTGRIFETLLYIGSVIILRHHTGGYHANTHWQCCILSISAYILMLLMLHSFTDVAGRISSIILALISLTVIFNLAPMVHANNPVREKSLSKHKLYCRVLSLTIALLIVAFLLAHYSTLALSLSFAMFQVCVFLLVEYKKNTRR